MKTRPITLFALMLGAAMLASATVDAGYVNNDGAYCTKDSTGAGYCYGNMRGFRNDPGANTYAEFTVQQDSNFFWFSANYNDQYFGCTFQDSSTKDAFKTLVGQTNGWFNINWDANGSCYFGYAYKGSRFGSSF